MAWCLIADQAGGEGCDQSSAATTSASDGATACGSRPPRPWPWAARERCRARAFRSARGRRAGRRAGRPGRRSGRRRRPSRSRRDASRSPRPRASRRSASTASEKKAGAGLPMIRARTPAANSSPVDVGARIEGRTVGRQPPRVAVHADQAGTAADQPEGDVEVGVGELVGESPTMTAAARAPGVAASPFESRCCPSNSVRASAEARTYSGCPGKARAAYVAEADRADWKRSGGISFPSFAANRGQRHPADQRGVGHDPVRASPVARAR